MEYTICQNCDYCNTDRKNEKEQVRCIRLSKFVNVNDKSCEYYHNEQMRKICEFLERQQKL